MTKITDSIIASTGDDMSIMVWNLINLKNIITLKPNPQLFIRSLSYSFDLDIFVAGKLKWFNECLV
jgi:hypothetical protein